MKVIPLRTFEKQKSVDLFNLVMSQSPTKAIPPAEMRQRIKIMDKLDAAKAADSVDLEDSEHQLLCSALESFPWATADRNIMRVIDDALDAKDAPPPAKNA